MLCDICHKREATIYYTEVSHGEKREQKICEQCAQEPSGFSMNAFLFNKDFSFSGLLSGMLGGHHNVSTQEKEAKAQTPVCENCNMTKEEFLKNGKFGCMTCYDTFNMILANNVKKIQGGDYHVGKIPKGYITKTEMIINKLSEKQKLTIALQEAIEKEEFEEAARLRDIIKTLKEDKANA